MHTSNNTCIANIINHIYHDDQGIHEINHRRQFIDKNESDCINFKQRRTLQPWCLDVVQAPPRVQARISSTLTSLTLFPMRSKKVCNLSSQAQLGRLNSNSILPQKYSAFNLLSNQPNASFYSAEEGRYRSTYEGIESSFKGISSSHQGVSSLRYGMHEP